VSNFAHTSGTVHLIPYLAQYGYTAALAAAIVGWIGAMQVAGRLAFVPIAAWLGARSIVAGIFIAQFVGTGLLAMLGHVPTVIPIIFLLGAANGMSTLARATWSRTSSGARITEHQRRTGPGRQRCPRPGADRCVAAVRCARKLRALFGALAGSLAVVSVLVVATNTSVVLYNSGAEQPAAR